MEEQKDIKELYCVIKHFEKEKWLEMATTADLAKEIVNKWCCPSQLKSNYDISIIQIIKKIKNNTNEYDGSLPEEIVEELLVDLANIIKGENKENDEN